MCPDDSKDERLKAGNRTRRKLVGKQTHLDMAQPPGSFLRHTQTQTAGDQTVLSTSQVRLNGQKESGQRGDCRK